MLCWIFAYDDCLKHTLKHTYIHTQLFRYWRTESGNNAQSLNYIAPTVN